MPPAAPLDIAHHLTIEHAIVTNRKALKQRIDAIVAELPLTHRMALLSVTMPLEIVLRDMHTLIVMQRQAIQHLTAAQS